MNHLLLYNNPKRTGWPPLQLVGVLDGYTTGQAFSGRLQILNQIGDCTAWLHKGQLPPGAVIWVDNPAREVVVEWPAYEPPPPPPPRPNLPPPPPPVPPRGLFNGDFEQGAKGWRLGPGWRLKDTPGHGVLGTAALACTFHGTSFAESDPVACEPGTNISAEALWYQGASNKRNVDLYTQLVWRDAAMREIGVASGNKVHNMDNRRSHWSWVTANAPAGTAYASVRLLMHRRRYAREVVVDSVNWTHFAHSPVTVPPQPTPPDEPPPPAPDPYLDTYCITIRCRDAAGREADWEGCIGEKLIWFTSRPYPVDADVEGLDVALTPDAVVLRFARHQSGMVEGLSSGLSVTSAELRALLARVESLEAIRSDLTLTAASLRKLLHTQTLPVENISSTLTLTTATLETKLITQALPVENISSTLTLTGAQLQ